MNTFILFLTMCGQLVMISAHGTAGYVVGAPEWIAANPPVKELVMELIKDEDNVQKYVQELAPSLHMECKGA